jgi:hypothetical protein
MRPRITSVTMPTRSKTCTSDSGLGSRQERPTAAMKMYGLYRRIGAMSSRVRSRLATNGFAFANATSALALLTVVATEQAALQGTCATTVHLRRKRAVWVPLSAAITSRALNGADPERPRHTQENCITSLQTRKPPWRGGFCLRARGTSAQL